MSEPLMKIISANDPDVTQGNAICANGTPTTFVVSSGDNSYYSLEDCSGALYSRFDNISYYSD